MKLIKNISLIAAMSMIMFSSCVEESSLDVDNSKIELSEQQVVATPEGGEFSIKVNSSEDWRVAGFAEWITLGNESGKSGSDLKLTVAPNEDTEVRTAEFKVFAGSATATLTITSNPDMFLELAKEGAVEIPSFANKFTVGVKTNSPEVTIEYADGADKWLENVGLVSGFSGKQLYEFQAKKTDKFKTRTGKIVFKMSGSDKVLSVDVNQAQLDTVIVVEGPKVVKGLEAVDFEINVKSNIDFSYAFPDWIEEKEKIVAEKDEETGLTTTTFKLHCDETVGTRAQTVEFTTRNGYYTVVLGKVLIKQQNPNPVFCTIPDKVLRNVLIGHQWVVLEDEAIGKCEIIADGMTGTKLEIEGDSYDPLNIKSFDGLESFPKLNYFSMLACNTANVDLSKVKNLKTVVFTDCAKIETFKMGDVALDNLTITLSDYGYQEFKHIVVSGSNVKNFDFSASSFYIGYYGDTESLDVTGMPKLETLDARRQIASWWGEPQPSSDFKTIYMTAAQKETVKVQKNEHTQIVVK